jgi:hypothetical protein
LINNIDSDNTLEENASEENASEENASEENASEENTFEEIDAAQGPAHYPRPCLDSEAKGLLDVFVLPVPYSLPPLALEKQVRPVVYQVPTANISSARYTLPDRK